MIKIETLPENIVLITIDRPKSLNAINSKVMSELGIFFEKADPSVIKGVIITGSGSKSFVAGADIDEFVDISTEQGEELSIQGQKVFNLIENFSKPTIALVNGYALGGGCELALACHMRISTSNAIFGMPELSLGLIPGFAGTSRLAILIGKGRAMEYILTGKKINAQESLTIGLSNYVLESKEEALDKAKDLISTISKRSPEAVGESIALINQTIHPCRGYLNHQAKEANAFGRLMTTDNTIEGIDAFKNKRKPNFK